LPLLTEGLKPLPLLLGAGLKLPPLFELGAGRELPPPPPDELPPEDGREPPPPPPPSLCWALAESTINEHNKPFRARVKKYLYVFFMIMSVDIL
jgi:hypothetical protein